MLIKATHLSRPAPNTTLQGCWDKFQFILNKLGCEHAAIRHFAHVFGAVDDAQMTGVYFKETRVARCNPSFGIFGIGGAFGFLIFNKGAGAAVKYFSIIANAHFYARAGYANSIGTHLAIRLLGDENGCLGLTVKLF